MATTLLLFCIIGWHSSKSTDSITTQPPDNSVITTETTMSTTTCSTTTSTNTGSRTSTSTSTTLSTTTTTVAETAAIATSAIPHTEPVTTVAVEPIVEEVSQTDLPITEQEFVLLGNVVSHEGGSSWLSEYERACIVAAIMNRVYDSRFPNTIDEVVHQPGQMFDVPYYRVDYSGIGYEPIDNAIYAYFDGKYSFDDINSWSGDGYANKFYHQ